MNTLAILAGVFSFLACENELEKVNLITQQELLPAEISRDIEITYSDSAKVKMRMKAPLLERYLGEKPYTEFNEGLEVFFYNSVGEEDSKLKANYAINYTDEKKLVAKGNVILVNRSGDQLNGEHLIWYEKTKRITSNEFVKITTEDEIIYGDGLDANEDFSQYKIKNIKGIINIKEDDNE